MRAARHDHDRITGQLRFMIARKMSPDERQQQDGFGRGGESDPAARGTAKALDAEALRMRQALSAGRSEIQEISLSEWKGHGRKRLSISGFIRPGELAGEHETVFGH